MILSSYSFILFLISYFCSGYGSQAVSSSNLSSEDSVSIKSISADDTPETELARGPVFVELAPVSEATPYFKADSVPSSLTEALICVEQQEPENVISSSPDMSESDFMTASQTSSFPDEDSPCEGTSVVHTTLPPGKVTILLR